MERAVMTENRGYEKKLLFSTVLGSSFESMSIMIISLVLSSIIAEFHLSSTLGGTISSLTNIGMLIGGVIFGVIADKTGRARMFKYTVLIFAVATFVIAFSPNVIFLSIFRFIAGIGSGGEYGIMMSLIIEQMGKEKKGRANSYVMAGAQIANIVMALLASAILPVAKWRVLFIIIGLIPLPLVIYIHKNLKESDEWLEGVRKQENKVSLSQFFDSGRKSATTILLVVMAAVECCGYYGLINWLPTILLRRFHLTAGTASLWSISITVGIFIGMLIFGRLVDRFGAIPCYIAFLIASIIAVLIYTYLSNVAAVLIFGTVVGLTTNGMAAGFGVLIGGYYPTAIRATANSSIFNAGRAIGGFSPILFGFIMDRYALSYVMFAMVAFYIVSLICAFILGRVGVRES